MHVCIAGMHRSGTSMVAGLLRRAGLYLGEEADLLPPAEGNPDGYFENSKFVELNEELLARLGGTYFGPPALATGWAEAAAALRDKAEDMLRGFAGHEPWGWKDPRNSLTLPFWTSLVGDLRTVICLRHPWDVADSLYRARYFPAYRLRAIAGTIKSRQPFPPHILNLVLWHLHSELEPEHTQALSKVVGQLRILLSGRRRVADTYRVGFHLWKVYNRCALGATARERRIITHYEAYLRDPRAEVRRILDFLRLPASDELISECCSLVYARPRQDRGASGDSAGAARVPADVLALYARMCEEAGFQPCK
jgi:hypothetical protein